MHFTPGEIKKKVFLTVPDTSCTNHPVCFDNEVLKDEKLFRRLCIWGSRHYASTKCCVTWHNY